MSSSCRIVINIGVVRGDFDSLGEICDGAVLVALSVEAAPAIGVPFVAAWPIVSKAIATAPSQISVRRLVCRGILRIDLDHLVIVSDRPVLVSLGSEDVAAVEVSI